MKHLKTSLISIASSLLFIVGFGIGPSPAMANGTIPIPTFTATSPFAGFIEVAFDQAPNATFYQCRAYLPGETDETKHKAFSSQSEADRVAGKKCMLGGLDKATEYVVKARVQVTVNGTPGESLWGNDFTITPGGSSSIQLPEGSTEQDSTPTPIPTPTPTTSSTPAKGTAAALAALPKSSTQPKLKFASSDNGLSSASKKSLKKVAEVAKDGYGVRVTGAAGMQPGVSESAVKALAKKRALEIRDYLIKQGVPKEDIIVKTKIFPIGKAPATLVKVETLS